MTNVALLREKINESGFKLRFIATKLGITYQGFLNKCNNDSEFKASEIQILCKLLSLSLQDKEDIFFAQNVDYMSTKERNGV